MRNLTEIYSQIAADSTTRCSHNSVIFTTAILFLVYLIRPHLSTTTHPRANPLDFDLSRA